MARDVLRHLRAKLAFLLRVGLGYLTLGRQTRTLSGGEAQRINLANQLGSQLVGTLYILDEPSIGLHARDTARLAELCGELAARRQHRGDRRARPRRSSQAPTTSWRWARARASAGATWCSRAPRRSSLRDPHSLTARYLTGRETIPLPLARREGRRALVLAGARAHNLKDVTLRIPLHTLTCVTGVSGSGKSTLVHDTLYRARRPPLQGRTSDCPASTTSCVGLEYLKGVRLIDQEPIGRTPALQPGDLREGLRRDPQALRRAATRADARASARAPSRSTCRAAAARHARAAGFQKLEMYFFEDVYVPCAECEGRRYRPEVLRVAYKGKDISQVLQLTVDEAVDFFAAHPVLARRLKRAAGGRARAICASASPRPPCPAARRSGSRSRPSWATRQTSDHLYILDEPTTGLHLDDVKKLLGCSSRLVDAGNTVIVVEHHLDVIKSADWVVDLGPEGGEAGGAIVAEGTPEQLAQVDGSYTGKFLRELLPCDPNGKGAAGAAACG